MPFDGTDHGKPRVSDVRNGRPTLPVLIAHQRATAAQRSTIERLLTDTTSPAGELYDAMVDLVQTTGAVQPSYNLARRYASQAQEVLRKLPPSRHRDALEDITKSGHLI